MSGKTGGPACKWCEAPAFRKQGRIMLCKKHYRFQAMRARAKRDGKTVPAYDELDALLPADMECCGCGRPMVWTQAEDRSRVISLQHDRDGTHRLLCRACNTRHSDTTAGPTATATGSTESSESDVRVFPGSLRDYFAGQDLTIRRYAPEGILGRLWGWLWYGPGCSPEEVARDAYEQADAMLAARSTDTEGDKG